MSSQGQVLQQLVKHYAINRKTMEWSDKYPASWADKEGFWKRVGLVMGWPIGTEKKDYTGWSDDYRATVPLTFDSKVKHDRAKIDTYYFTSGSGPLPIDPAQVAAMGRPLEIPKDRFQALVEGANVSAVVKAAVPMLLKQLEGDNVPLQYYYEYEGEYWIEPTTGVLIDTKKHELRKVGLPDDVLAKVPLLSNLTEEQKAAQRVTVSDFTYWSTDQTVQDAKKDAEDAKGKIQLFGTTLPIIAILVGLVLGIAGAFLILRKPGPPRAETSQ
jgi:hypothetical protein